MRRDTSRPNSGHELSWKLLCLEEQLGIFPMSSTLRRSATGKLQNMANQTELFQTHHGFSAGEKTTTTDASRAL